MKAWLLAAMFLAVPETTKVPKPFIGTAYLTDGSYALVATCPKGYYIEAPMKTDPDLVMRVNTLAGLQVWKEHMLTLRCERE